LSIGIQTIDRSLRLRAHFHTRAKNFGLIGIWILDFRLDTDPATRCLGTLLRQALSILASGSFLSARLRKNQDRLIDAFHAFGVKMRDAVSQFIVRHLAGVTLATRTKRIRNLELEPVSGICSGR
jgi:hypothetical protein